MHVSTMTMEEGRRREELTEETAEWFQPCSSELLTLLLLPCLLLSFLSSLQPPRLSLLNPLPLPSDLLTSPSSSACPTT